MTFTGRPRRPAAAPEESIPVPQPARGSHHNRTGVASRTTIATANVTAGPHTPGSAAVQESVSPATATTQAPTHPTISTSRGTHHGTAAAVHRSMRGPSIGGAPGRVTGTASLQDHLRHDAEHKSVQALPYVAGLYRQAGDEAPGGAAPRRTAEARRLPDLTAAAAHLAQDLAAQDFEEALEALLDRITLLRPRRRSADTSPT